MLVTTIFVYMVHLQSLLMNKILLHVHNIYIDVF